MPTLMRLRQHEGADRTKPAGRSPARGIGPGAGFAARRCATRADRTRRSRRAIAPRDRRSAAQQPSLRRASSTAPPARSPPRCSPTARVEHYRGSFKNKAMYTPLVVSALTLATSVHGTADMRPVAHKARDAIYLLAAATGLVGTGFHVYNVGKKVGGFSWQNLFYGAPLGAPMAILLSGLLGFCSERVREATEGSAARSSACRPDEPSPRSPAPACSARPAKPACCISAAPTTIRSWSLPVTLPPIGAALLASAAAGRPRQARIGSRAGGCGSSRCMGFAGVGFHAYGVSRNMGGWRNWSQNILNGPPLPAPPSFTGLALAGLAALGSDEGASRCMMQLGDRYPGYDVLAKWTRPVLERQDARGHRAPAVDRARAAVLHARTNSRPCWRSRTGSFRSR